MGSDAGEFVALDWKRNRGWPWPEESFGLTPMFGADGWCHSCGVPRRHQCGPLVLQRRGLGRVRGAWVPNWQFDVICLDSGLADDIAARFGVEVREVEWHGRAPGARAKQLVVPTVGESWFDHRDLRKAAIARHGTAGATCRECGVWRWMPLILELLPPLSINPALSRVDVAASPEWFGDGWKAFRQILLRRELAEMIVAGSPRDFEVVTLDLHQAMSARRRWWRPR